MPSNAFKMPLNAFKCLNFFEKYCLKNRAWQPVLTTGKATGNGEWEGADLAVRLKGGEGGGIQELDYLTNRNFWIFFT